MLPFAKTGTETACLTARISSQSASPSTVRDTRTNDLSVLSMFVTSQVDPDRSSSCVHIPSHYIRSLSSINHSTPRGCDYRLYIAARVSVEMYAACDHGGT